MAFTITTSAAAPGHIAATSVLPAAPNDIVGGGGGNGIGLTTVAKFRGGFCGFAFNAGVGPDTRIGASRLMATIDWRTGIRLGARTFGLLLDRSRFRSIAASAFVRATRCSVAAVVVVVVVVEGPPTVAVVVEGPPTVSKAITLKCEIPGCPASRIARP